MYGKKHYKICKFTGLNKFKKQNKANNPDLKKEGVKSYTLQFIGLWKQLSF